MAYTYTFCNAENTLIERTEESSDHVLYIPCCSENRDYQEFVASGAVAGAYEVPGPVPELTPEERLAAAGLTVEELQQLLGL